MSFKKGHIAWNKGKHQLKETKEKISSTSKGKKKPPFSAEHRKKISETLKGKHLSEETKRKISELSKGKNNPRYGIKPSEETRKKISKSCKGKKLSEETKQKISEAFKGDKHPNWKGGISEPYPTDWVDDLRESIRKRDNYICQLCGIHQEELVGWTKKLDIHHIDYNKYNLSPQNLISLCRNCHQKTNFNREYWKQYFIKYGRKE